MKIPQTAPKECIYIETGLIDPETIIKKNRINKEYQIRNGNNKSLKERIIENPIKNGWLEKKHNQASYRNNNRRHDGRKITSEEQNKTKNKKSFQNENNRNGLQ